MNGNQFLSVCVGTAAIVVGLISTGCRQVTRQSETDAPPPPLSVGKSLTLGGIKLSVNRITRTTARVRRAGVGPYESIACLKLDCSVENVSEGQVIDPIAWMHRCQVTDNFGNRLKPIAYPFILMLSGFLNGHDEELGPGESWKVAFVVDTPRIETATEFTWEVALDVNNSGDTESFYIKFSRDEIGADPTKDKED